MASKERQNTMVFGKSTNVMSVGPAIQRDTRTAELCIAVLYGTPETTKEALRYASRLGLGLSMNLSVIEIEVVPYSCPLDQPPINPAFARRRLESLAAESGVSIRADVVYARDREEALTRRLDPGSLVLIPVKRFWGRMREKRLMRKLMKHGHEVVLVACQ